MPYYAHNGLKMLLAYKSGCEYMATINPQRKCYVIESNELNA